MMRSPVGAAAPVMDSAELDRFADEYHAQHSRNIAITGEGPEYFAEYKIRELRAIVEARGAPAASIIDFGSGIGNSIPHFRRYFPGAQLACADVSERSMELSRSRFPGDETYLLIDDAIPSAGGRFDIAFSACVFHHIAHDEHGRWLEELARVTRSGGLAVIFEHNPLNPLTVRAVRTCPFDENARLIGAAALARALERHGWRSASIRYHLFFPRFLSLLRPFERRLRWLPLGAQYSVSARKD
jgi:SAM-dependent methyltransferase